MRQENTMRILTSIYRWFATLGGLLSSSIDENRESMMTTPEGIRATYREAKDQWRKQFHELRDAIASLENASQAKRDQLQKVNAEDERTAQLKQGAANKFKETREAKWSEQFQALHKRDLELDVKRDELTADIAGLEQRVESYMGKLTKMEQQIKSLDIKEQEAIADIVTSKAVVDIIDRTSNMSTDLHNENLAAIEQHAAKMRAKARIAEKMDGSSASAIEDEMMAASVDKGAMDALAAMIGEEGLKSIEGPVGGALVTEDRTKL